MKYSALIIGCGNIGAMYDLGDPGKVWTHARAYSKSRNITFSVSDVDESLAKRVAKKYQVNQVNISPSSDFSSYDIVSITTPTPTHFEYLQALLKQHVPLIICEKPVVSESGQAAKLKNLYEKSGSRVLVNYIRRFQPAYHDLRRIISAKLLKNSCKGINIKYQRGFLNNGGHAFDLLEFLFNAPFRFENFKTQSSQFDAFSYDPTISGTCNFQGASVAILGIVDAGYPIFEIEIFFDSGKIVICHSGNDIRHYEFKKAIGQVVENKRLRKEGILKTYMLPVIKNGLALLANKDEKDNFIDSLELNKAILRLVKAQGKKN